jgi:hypothetical protein
MQINRRFESFVLRSQAWLRVARQPQFWLAAIKRKALQLIALTVNLLLLAGVWVFAHHLPFTDVPTSGALHDVVSAIYGARITAGTSETTYSPDNPVTRGQMAFFLHRGLGRTAFDTNASVNLGATQTDLAVITLTAGGAPGGVGFVKLDASVTSSTVATPTTGCPCELNIQIVQDGANASDIFWANLPNGQDGVLGNVSSSATWVTSVPTSTTQTFRLKASFSDSAGTIPANETYGGLTLIYVPFGSSGGSTAQAAGASLAGQERQAKDELSTDPPIVRSRRPQ